MCNKKSTRNIKGFSCKTRNWKEKSNTCRLNPENKKKHQKLILNKYQTITTACHVQPENLK